MNKKILVFFLSSILLATIVAIVLLTDGFIEYNLDNKEKSYDNEENNKWTLEEAFEYAEKSLLPLDGIVGVGYVENPPRITVYISSEYYRDIVPDEIKGYRTEVILSGEFVPNEP